MLPLTGISLNSFGIKDVTFAIMQISGFNVSILLSNFLSL
jgi:hypothetical protein